MPEPEVVEPTPGEEEQTEEPAEMTTNTTEE